MSNEIIALEKQIYELNMKLAKLRAASTESGREVPDYQFQTLHGPVSLSSLFAGRDTLFAIHNMGQACRWCTLWADGINPFLPHLEDKFSVVLLSKDPPEQQQRMAHSRGWRFRMGSHGGTGPYQKEIATNPDGTEGGQMDLSAGVVVYVRDGDTIRRKASAVFGPYDQYCSIWNFLSLAGVHEDDWTPQYSYWKAPGKHQMEDGGKDLPCH